MLKILSFRAVLASSCFRTLFASFCLLFLLFLLFPQKTLAATFTFEGAPPSISDNQSFFVNVTLFINDSSGKSYYIRAAFSHPDSSTSYFGYTKNNAGDWYNGEPKIDKTQFYKAIMDEGDQKTFTIEVKPDSESTFYKNKGPATYNFKLGRYTELGTSPTWCDNKTTYSTGYCNIASISISSASTPTPTPTSTLTPTPTPTPSPTKTPTPKPSTPKPTTSIIQTPTPKATTVSVSLAREINSSQSPKDILGTESSKPSVKPTNKPQDVKTLSASENNLSKILIGLGVIILISGAGIFLKSFIKPK